MRSGKETYLHIVESLNEGLLLADNGAELVHGGRHTSERGKALNTLNIVHLEGELAEVVALAVEVTEGESELAAEKVITGSALTDSLVSGGNAEATVREVGGSLEGEPLLTLEGVDSLLATLLLSLTNSSLLANSHWCCNDGEIGRK